LSDLLNYTPTPIQEIFDEVLEKAGVRLRIKREDLNHPYVCGNKWWKLKYNLAEAERNKKTILTFGGAFSNHIFATAAAANELGFKSIGIIRGEKTLPLNPTLAFAERRGMELHYISREEYRKKDEAGFVQILQDRFGDFYRIPEGGTNQLAIKGCEEFAKMHLTADFDYLFLPVGTGGTVAGIITGLRNTKKIIGISVLKNGEFLKNEVGNLLKDYSGNEFQNWSINTDYHYGGYAKSPPELKTFIQNFEHKHSIPIEHVYSAKMFGGIFDLVKKGLFPKGISILAVHTGGLQGKLSPTEITR